MFEEKFLKEQRETESLIMHLNPPKSVGKATISMNQSPLEMDEYDALQREQNARTAEALQAGVQVRISQSRNDMMTSLDKIEGYAEALQAYETATNEIIGSIQSRRQSIIDKRNRLMEESEKAADDARDLSKLQMQYDLAGDKASASRAQKSSQSARMRIAEIEDQVMALDDLLEEAKPTDEEIAQLEELHKTAEGIRVNSAKASIEKAKTMKTEAEAVIVEADKLMQTAQNVIQQGGGMGEGRTKDTFKTFCGSL